MVGFAELNGDTCKPKLPSGLLKEIHGGFYATSTHLFLEEIERTRRAIQLQSSYTDFSISATLLRWCIFGLRAGVWVSVRPIPLLLRLPLRAPIAHTVCMRHAQPHHVAHFAKAFAHGWGSRRCPFFIFVLVQSFRRYHRLFFQCGPQAVAHAAQFHTSLTPRLPTIRAPPSRHSFLSPSQKPLVTSSARPSAERKAISQPCRSPNTSNV